MSAANRSGMSQVDGVNDIVTDITATQPFIAVTDPPKEATNPAPAEQEGEGARAQMPGASTRDRWPRWPAAWPDSSLPSRSGRAGQ
jgi:hypothetical protein